MNKRSGITAVSVIVSCGDPINVIWNTTALLNGIFNTGYSARAVISQSRQTSGQAVFPTDISGVAAGPRVSTTYLWDDTNLSIPSTDSIRCKITEKKQIWYYRLLIMKHLVGYGSHGYHTAKRIYPCPLGTTAHWSILPWCKGGWGWNLQSRTTQF